MPLDPAARLSEVAQPLGLPFVGSPHPDELLGSWLARIVANDAYSSFKACFDPIFPGEHFNSGRLINIFAASSRVEALLRSLGWEADDALVKLTTYPYWARFEASSVPSDAGLQVQSLTLRYAVGSGPTNALLTRVHGKHSTLRICPQCMGADRKSVGGPYFHRVHQLPLVRRCIVHRCELLAACPSCSRSFGGQIYPEALRTNCQCGLALDDVQTIEVGGDEPWLRLAAVSAEVLAGRSVHPLHHWVDVLPRRIKDERPKGHGRVLPLLRAYYGREWLSSIATGWKSAAPVASASEPLTFGSAALRGPHICAIIAASGFSLNDLECKTTKPSVGRDATTTSPGKSQVTPKRARLLTPVDVADARRQALSVTARSDETSAMRELSRKHPTLYWYLAILDTDWLTMTLGSGSSAPPTIPTVVKDRATITRLLRANRTSVATKRLNISTPAVFRARVRDSQWLDGQRRDYASQSQATADTKILKIFTASSEKVIRQPGRPRRVTMSSLASAAGLPRDTVANLVRRHPQLKDFCTESDEGYAKRCAAWAVSELVRTKTLMSASDLVRFAGLKTGKGNADLVRAELTKAGLPILRAGRGQAPAPSGFRLVRPLLSSSGKQLP
jgi:hypothetical protein